MRPDTEQAPVAALPASDTSPFTRRQAIVTLGALGAAAAITQSACAQTERRNPAAAPAPIPGWDDRKNEYVLPPLPYEYDALVPHIDAQTMRIHHEKHHAGYVAGANKALAELAKIRSGQSDASLIKHWSRELSFNASGHVNHTLFWLTMAPEGRGGGGKPSGELAEAINRDFGSFEAFTKHFKAAAGAVEGGGWGWLVHEPVSATLQVLQAEKQQNLTVWGVSPLLGVDVWEHAYYLKYQNRRAEYIDAFMNVINWDAVAGLFAAARAS